MSEADNLIAKLYPEDDSYLDGMWNTFVHLHPNGSFFRQKNLRRAIEEENSSKLINPIRMGFFPDVDSDEDIQEKFRQAMNRGIGAINSLCQEFLTDDEAYDFRIDRISHPFDILEFVKRGDKLWELSRKKDSKNYPKPGLKLAAYSKSRAYDLGYRVLLIDESPEVIASIRNHRLVLDWFNRFLDFDSPEDTNNPIFSMSWLTSAGVRVFGNESPIRSRVKVLYSDGSLKYSSLLMKMLLKQSFFDGIGDYTGIELVVEDDEARQEIKELFVYSSKPTMRLEGYKDMSKKEKRDNLDSSIDFGVVKFNVRPPTPMQLEDGSKVYQRTPVEVQILTLGDDRIRRENPDVIHEAYKKRQFMKVFPAWFPRQIYEPLIREHVK